MKLPFVSTVHRPLLIIYFAEELSLNYLSPQKLYSEYSGEQGKKFNRAEQRVRLGLFRKTLQTIAEHNSRDESWEMGLNQFSDMVSRVVIDD